MSSRTHSRSNSTRSTSSNRPERPRHHVRLSEALPTRPTSTPPFSFRSPPSPLRFEFTEKLTEEPLDGVVTKPEAGPSRHASKPSLSRRVPSRQNSAPSQYPSPLPAISPAPNFALPTPSLHSDYAHPPRSIRFFALVKPWLPLLAYLSTSLGFLIAIAFWRKQVFQGLDDLSSWLKADKHFGYGVLFFLIFLTTFPPLPLYSTLIVLSGYTFGAPRGAVVSYCAALTGAIVVFVLSRYLFHDSISRWLSSAKSIKRVVRAIEKRPKLLFLIRLAPYPYNVMNCLLAASPTLTLRTYVLCTALSLFKVIIHTTLGSSIHSFARYHVARPEKDKGTDSPADGSPDSPADAPAEEGESPIGMVWTIVGIVLCVGIIAYLSYVTRKAVDTELGDDEDGDLPTHTDEETAAFLVRQSGEDEDEDEERVPMSETPFRTVTPATRADSRAEGWTSRERIPSHEDEAERGLLRTSRSLDATREPAAIRLL
ncbi:hypothetical protein OF83DRAFT_1083905 [Amylostereum chailletii]|nr:hypothetical protein OF83DRAFT_1083905 [Amylostereum chailletii]